jgi:hypothetical protein
MKTINFLKENGAIYNRDSLFYRLEGIFNTLTNGNYKLTVTKDVKKRTLDQNSTMWMWFECLSRETGTDRQIIHDYYCTKFLRSTKTINGIERSIVSGTSKLNTAQFSDFMMKIQADAAQEFGCVLPNPDDLHFAGFADSYSKYLNA